VCGWKRREGKKDIGGMCKLMFYTVNPPLRGGFSRKEEEKL
jgi:hypothetical protein